MIERVPQNRMRELVLSLQNQIDQKKAQSVMLEEESEGEELLIDPYVESIAFEYLEIKEDETQGTWLDEWDLEEEDRQQKLPRAVRISLRVEEGGKDVQVPPFVVRIYAYDPIL